MNTLIALVLSLFQGLKLETSEEDINKFVEASGGAELDLGKLATAIAEHITQNSTYSFAQALDIVRALLSHYEIVTDPGRRAAEINLVLAQIADGKRPTILNAVDTLGVSNETV
jgi:hypothetical protein